MMLLKSFISSGNKSCMKSVARYAVKYWSWLIGLELILEPIGTMSKIKCTGPWIYNN